MVSLFLQFIRRPTDAANVKSEGSDSNVSTIVLQENQSHDDVGDAVLGQAERFVAAVDIDRTFRFLADQDAALESFAKEYRKHGAPMIDLTP